MARREPLLLGWSGDEDPRRCRAPYAEPGIALQRGGGWPCEYHVAPIFTDRGVRYGAFDRYGSAADWYMDDTPTYANWLAAKLNATFDRGRRDGAQTTKWQYERIAAHLMRPLLHACRAWVEYFDRLDADGDPDGPLARARRMFHGERIEATRRVIDAAVADMGRRGVKL